LAERLADDVPAGHLDRRAGELVGCRAADLLARHAVDREPLRDATHLERVEADVERLRLENRRDELRAAVRLPEPDEAFIGDELDDRPGHPWLDAEAPTERVVHRHVYRRRANVDDLHGLSWRRRRGRGTEPRPPLVSAGRPIEVLLDR